MGKDRGLTEGAGEATRGRKNSIRKSKRKQTQEIRGTGEQELGPEQEAAEGGGREQQGQVRGLGFLASSAS